MKKKVLISSCLYNIKCRYDGSCINNPYLKMLDEYYELIPVCAEELGGLTIPRKPSEITSNKVLAIDGEDVTVNFKEGALKVLEIALSNNIEIAILKDNSPSCGSRLVYDGTFSGNKVLGEGITCKLLRKNGIKVISENEINTLFNCLD